MASQLNHQIIFSVDSDTNANVAAKVDSGTMGNLVLDSPTTTYTAETQVQSNFTPETQVQSNFTAESQVQSSFTPESQSSFTPETQSQSSFSGEVATPMTGIQYTGEGSTQGEREILMWKVQIRGLLSSNKGFTVKQVQLSTVQASDCLMEVKSNAENSNRSFSALLFDLH